MKTFSATILFLLLSLTGSIAAQDKKYESKDGKYAIAFPETPKVDSKKAGELSINTAAVDAKGVGFMVIHTDLPADTVKASTPEEILANGEKGLVTNFKAKVTKSQAMMFGKEKYPGRTVNAEVNVDTVTLQLRLTIVLANNRLYQVLVIGQKDAVGGGAVDKFFESFEIKK